MDYKERYDLYTAAAWIRGHQKMTGVPLLTQEQQEQPLELLTEEESEKILAAAKAAELKLYPFKK